MKVSISTLAIILAVQQAIALPAEQAEKPGLTREEWLEYLTLNTTEGWEPMARVPQYKISAGETLDLSTTTLFKRSLEKRGSGNAFAPSYYGGCATREFTVRNFGCGACVTAAGAGQLSWESSWLWRETTGNPYPTVEWYNERYCTGTKVHHQGIYSGRDSSCDTAGQGNQASVYLSAMLYQGC